MDALLTVVVALIVAISTLGATWLANRNSSKHFEKELEKAREDAQRQRKWEVRSVPLLKLREELAIITGKQELLLFYYTRVLTTEVDKASVDEAQKSLDDLSAYLESGELWQTLVIQYDKELKDVAEEIMRDYMRALSISRETTDPGEVSKITRKNKTRIVEIQELINKRLEEL